jgi:hypothetical protein
MNARNVIAVLTAALSILQAGATYAQDHKTPDA